SSRMAAAMPCRRAAGTVYIRLISPTPSSACARTPPHPTALSASHATRNVPRGGASSSACGASGSSAPYRARKSSRSAATRDCATSESNRSVVSRGHGDVGCSPLIAGPSTHERAPLVETVDAEHVVPLARLAHGRERVGRVEMSRVEDRVVGNDREPLCEALVHRVGIRTRQIGAATPFEEQRVAGDELAVDQEALAPRRVAGGVHERDAQVADGHDVAAVVEHEIGVEEPDAALDPLSLGPLHVQLHRDVVHREELADPLDAVPHDVAADVIRVVMGAERAGQSHAVGGRHLDELTGPVRGIDDDRFAFLAVTDEVHEVDHLTGEHVVTREIASREELTEVEAVVLGHSHDSTPACGCEAAPDSGHYACVIAVGEPGRHSILRERRARRNRLIVILAVVVVVVAGLGVWRWGSGNAPDHKTDRTKIDLRARWQSVDLADLNRQYLTAATTGSSIAGTFKLFPQSSQRMSRPLLKFGDGPGSCHAAFVVSHDGVTASM